MLLNASVLLLAFASLARAGVLIWGEHDLLVPSLKQFNDADLAALRAQIGSPKILAFQGSEISDNLQDLLQDKYTAYVPNASLMVDDVVDLNGDSEENYRIIKSVLDEHEGIPTLALLISSGEPRAKRDAEEDPPEPEPTDSDYEPPTGPILYKSKENGMVYSSKPPILKTNQSTITLGESTIVTVDNRDGKFVKLSVTIPVINGKVTLRFKFLWSLGGYWNLSSVSLEDTDSKPYRLTTLEAVRAARRFSYHCSGETLFTGQDNQIELRFFDLQIQPDTTKGRFSDAYDCVNFMTVPIWSGIFVTSILVSVLAIGLAALNSIKTMDKFDNAKTKQLTITNTE